MFDFIKYSTKSKYYDKSNKLVIGNIERWNHRHCDWRVCWTEAKNVFILIRQKQK